MEPHPDRLFLPETGPQIPSNRKDKPSTEYRRHDPYIIEAFGRMMMETVDLNNPDFIIWKDDQRYLERWYLRRARGDDTHGNIYLHRINLSDQDRDFHDHPWDSTSIILDGVLTEYRQAFGCCNTPGCEFRKQIAFERTMHPGDIEHRFARIPHRLVVEQGPVWTLFLTGPKLHSWGFCTEQGWMHHTDYAEVYG